MGLARVSAAHSVCCKTDHHNVPQSYTSHSTLLLQAARAPTVSFGGTAGTFYTLIMVDPDAPSPDSPTMAQWIHWIVANIPGESRTRDCPGNCRA